MGNFKTHQRGQIDPIPPSSSKLPRHQLRGGESLNHKVGITLQPKVRPIVLGSLLNSRHSRQKLSLKGKGDAIIGSKTAKNRCTTISEDSPSTYITRESTRSAVSVALNPAIGGGSQST